MNSTPESGVRELDRRINDGIEVTLLWNSHTGRVSVAVEDSRRDESFEFEVEPSRALAAFFHPYAHAPATTAIRRPASAHGVGQPIRRTTDPTGDTTL